MHRPDDPTVFQRLLPILKASRPVGWFFGPLLFGIGLNQSGAILKTLSLPTVAIEAFALSFPLGTILYGINDVYDYDTDIRNPRKLTSGPGGGILLPVHHNSVRLAAYLSTVFILLVSLLIFQPQNSLATVLTLIGSWQYSAPPLRIKEIPVLDSLSSGLGAWLEWFIGYSFGGGQLSNVPVTSYVFALCLTGAHALAAAVDAESDRAAGQTTIATFFGQHSAAIFAAISYGTALFIENSGSILALYLWGSFVIMLIPCLYVQWAYHSYKALACWTIGLSLVWFGSISLSAR